LGGTVSTFALISTTTPFRTRRLIVGLTVFVGVMGAAVGFAAPALVASTPRPPSITPTRATFTIPSGSSSMWLLRLWSHGALEGSDHGTTGTLSVDVPAVTGCSFQADVTVTPADGVRYFYSGARATLPGCGPPATLAGDIDLCTASGTPTSTEVPGGTLSATGPQDLPSQSNPVPPTHVTAGSYSMTAGAPAGYVFVACGGPATIGSSGVVASLPVVVPPGGAASGTFYVVATAPTGSLTGGGSPGGSGGGAATSPGRPTTVSALPQSHTSPTAVGGRLAFTGLDTVPPLLVGLGALVLGAMAIALSRRRRHYRRPAHLRR